ncbi:MAG: FKBP-type peptidyl-prolyl cis-trans isomerase [Acidimicrobiales bacterium]
MSDEDTSAKPHVFVSPGEAPPGELIVEDLGGRRRRGGARPTGRGALRRRGLEHRRKQFDASWDRNGTFSFGLGAGEVIAGWDQGVAGMKVGGRRRITILPHLGYGKRGAGGVIGPNETLVFVVDLLAVG